MTPVLEWLAAMSWFPSLPVSPMTLAYIDPGTGALVLQMVVGAVVGVFIFARNQVRRFMAWVGGMLGLARASGDGEDADGGMGATVRDSGTGDTGSTTGGGSGPRDG